MTGFVIETIELRKKFSGGGQAIDKLNLKDKSSDPIVLNLIKSLNFVLSKNLEEEEI